MPQKNASVALAAGMNNDNIFANWQYEYLPWPARLKLIMRATAATLLATIYSGSETIMEESPVQAGGTAGVTPSELNTAPIVWDAPAGDRVKVKVRSTDAGVQTVDAIIYAFPIVG